MKLLRIALFSLAVGAFLFLLMRIAELGFEYLFSYHWAIILIVWLMLVSGWRKILSEFLVMISGLLKHLLKVSIHSALAASFISSIIVCAVFIFRVLKYDYHFIEYILAIGTYLLFGLSLIEGVVKPKASPSTD